MAGAFLPGYLAGTRPRRDIVVLLAPLYAVLIFIVPLEMNPNLLLQVLFSVSITILVVRLYFRFSSKVNRSREEESMEKFLYEYIRRITPFFRDLDPNTAHEIASVVLSFKFGLYIKTRTSANRAASRLNESGPYKALKRALQIVEERSAFLEDAGVAFSEVRFSQADETYLPFALPPDTILDMDTYTLENALVFLYAVAYLESPDDGQSLDEHQNFVLQILETYREPLGLK